MRSILLGADLLKTDPEKFEVLSAAVFRQLKSLSVLYPNFEDWYTQKVMPGLLLGERKILLRYLNGNLGGIAIVKQDALEKKLCCLRVLPEFNGSGLGLRLFQDSFEALNTDKPLLSVAEEHLPDFERVFAHFGFELAHRYRDLYRKSRTEYSFNGALISGTQISED